MIKDSGSISKVIKDYELVFWDFDGVIKDSVDVKTSAFISLFPDAPDSILKKISQHHLRNGGMSRFEKIPLYLGWSGLNTDEAAVARYCNIFSEKVCQAVIDSKWVPGVFEYLACNYMHQKFVLITGTPIDEIEFILTELKIRNYFFQVHGAPKKKSPAIQESLEKFQINPKESISIGDSLEDYEAARENNVSFVLRVRGENLSLFKDYSGLKFESLD